MYSVAVVAIWGWTLLYSEVAFCGCCSYLFEQTYEHLPEWQLGIQYFVKHVLGWTYNTV